MSNASAGSSSSQKHTGSGGRSRKLFKCRTLALPNSRNARPGRKTGCRRWPPCRGTQMHVGCVALKPTVRFSVGRDKCGWSPRTMAQCVRPASHPRQRAAHRMELNMPRSGAGFQMRFAGKMSRRSSSVSSNREPAAPTTAIWRAPRDFHSSNRWPMTEVFPHGSNNLGRPIRAERPAARSTTASRNLLLALAPLSAGTPAS